MSSDELHIPFDHLPRILSSLSKDVKEIKNFIIHNQKDAYEPDEWMDIRDLCAYHPNHPSKKTVYHWVAIRRIPYHKEGKHILFSRAEIDAWLLKGYHRTSYEMVEESIGYVNNHR